MTEGRGLTDLLSQTLSFNDYTSIQTSERHSPFVLIKNEQTKPSSRGRDFSTGRGKAPPSYLIKSALNRHQSSKNRARASTTLGSKRQFDPQSVREIKNHFYKAIQLQSQTLDLEEVKPSSIPPPKRRPTSPNEAHKEEPMRTPVPVPEADALSSGEEDDEIRIYASNLASKLRIQRVRQLKKEHFSYQPVASGRKCFINQVSMQEI